MEPFSEPRFEWGMAVRDAMQEHVRRAVDRLDPDRYSQEPAYVAALVARLDGVVYDDRDARVEIVGTVVADRGRGSAEAKWGADFAFTATLIQDEKKEKKAVLGQAKRGRPEHLNHLETGRLGRQCEKMLKATLASVVLSVPVHFGERPLVSLLDDTGKYQRTFDLADYLSDLLMTCRHGDTRGDFVRSAMSSNLTGLHIMATDASGWPV
jgi:hypothetical protein